MPTYDYTCEDCGEAFEIRASISEYSKGLKPKCISCGSAKTSRSFSAATVLTASRGSSGNSRQCSGHCPPNCSC